jgi:hypothetical protein
MKAIARAFQIQGNPKDIVTLKWVYVFPHDTPVGVKNDWLKEMYETYYRLMFLTRRKVWFKNKRGKKEHRVVLVPSPHALSSCDLLFLKKKGFPIKTQGCSRDTCFACHKKV